MVEMLTATAGHCAHFADFLWLWADFVSSVRSHVCAQAVIMLDIFETDVTSVRWWKWFTETRQTILVTGQIHGCLYSTTHTHPYMHTYMHTNTLWCVHMHACMHTCKHTDTYTHTHTHTHKHTHTLCHTVLHLKSFFLELVKENYCDMSDIFLVYAVLNQWNSGHYRLTRTLRSHACCPRNYWLMETLTSHTYCPRNYQLTQTLTSHAYCPRNYWLTQTQTSHAHHPRNYRLTQTLTSHAHCPRTCHLDSSTLWIRTCFFSLSPEWCALKLWLLYLYCKNNNNKKHV